MERREGQTCVTMEPFTAGFSKDFQSENGTRNGNQGDARQSFIKWRNI